MLSTVPCHRRFVTKKAFEHGLKPIVVINKVDRPGTPTLGDGSSL